MKNVLFVGLIKVRHYLGVKPPKWAETKISQPNRQKT